EGRVIDVSRKVAQLLGFYHKGTAKVHVKTVMPDTIMLARGHLDDEAMQLAEVSTGEAAAFILPPVTSFSTPQLKTTGKQKDQEIYLASSSPYEADSAVLQKKIEEISAIYEPDSAILQRKIEEASTMDAPSVSPVRVSVRPVKKSPMPVRTVTPQIVNDIFSGPNITTWGAYSPVFNASSYQKLRLTWFFSTPSASFSVQVSNNQATWTTFKQGQNSGSADLILYAPYVRVFLTSGSCVSGYCETPTPTWAQPYSVTIKGFFSN
ncbi:hypothetical protein EBZ57_03550, partial [bacterium]|nr:hypothetical protein [bacterium]